MDWLDRLECGHWDPDPGSTQIGTFCDNPAAYLYTKENRKEADFARCQNHRLTEYKEISKDEFIVREVMDA